MAVQACGHEIRWKTRVLIQKSRRTKFAQARMTMKKLLYTLLLSTLLSVYGFSQDKRWTELTRRDAEKILNDSGWGKTQVDTDTSEMMYSPTVTPTTSSRDVSTDSNRAERGALNQEVHVKYRIRFLSAKPVRQ